MGSAMRALAVAIWLVLVLRPAEDPAPLEIGTPLKGAIAATDPIADTPRLRAAFDDAPVRCRTLALAVPAPGVYTIDLRSHFFDAYLVLRDARTGAVVAEDDNGYLRSHARLVARDL